MERPPRHARPRSRTSHARASWLPPSASPGRPTSISPGTRSSSWPWSRTGSRSSTASTASISSTGASSSTRAPTRRARSRSWNSNAPGSRRRRAGSSSPTPASTIAGDTTAGCSASPRRVARCGRSRLPPLRANIEGGIWMGGAAPVVDPAGDIWFTAANGRGPDLASLGREQRDRSSCRRDSVSCSASGTHMWRADNIVDFDLGSTNAGPGERVRVHRREGGHRVPGAPAAPRRGRRPGGQPGALSAGDANGGSAWGGTAVDGSVLYVNCDDGEPGNAHFSHITAVRVTKRRSVSPRRVAVDHGAHRRAADRRRRHGLDDPARRERAWSGSARPADSPRSRSPSGSTANHFPTPSVRGRPAPRPLGEERAGVRRPVGLPPPPPPPAA